MAENETSQVCVHIHPNQDVNMAVIVAVQSQDGTAVCKFDIKPK